MYLLSPQINLFVQPVVWRPELKSKEPWASFTFSVLGSSIKAEKKILKIGAIPDQNQEILDRRFNSLSKELSQQLNVEVKYYHIIIYILMNLLIICHMKIQNKY